MSEPSPSYGKTPDIPPCPDTSFEAQYKRVFTAAECRTQMQLAAVLDIRQSSISDAKRRKAVPSDWLVKLFEKQRLNPEWVRTGTGPMRLGYPETKDTRPMLSKSPKSGRLRNVPRRNYSPNWSGGRWSLWILRQFKKK